MDPISTFAIVQGAGGLALKCVSLAKTLNDFAAKYKYAKLTVLSMVQHLEIVQLAWERIDKWSQKYAHDGVAPHCAEDEKLLRRLQTSLEVGFMVMEALEEDLMPFRRHLDDLGLRDKTKIVWSESAAKAHQDRLGHQVQAMTCLLQTIRLEMPETQRSLLEIAEPILLKSDESAYSIVPSRMSSRVSLSTTQSAGGTSLRYHYLAFEDSLFTAKVYKRNYRNFLIEQLCKTRSNRKERLVASRNIANAASDAQVASGTHPASNSSKRSSTMSDLSLIDHCQKNATGLLKKSLAVHRVDISLGISFDVFRWCLNEAVINDRLEVTHTLLDFGPQPYITQLMEAEGLSLIDRAYDTHKVGLLKLIGEQAIKYVGSIARLHLNDLLRRILAVEGHPYDMILTLIDAGADINLVDNQGRTALHLISADGDAMHYITALWQCGAIIDPQTDDGMTPLLYACLSGHIGNIYELLAYGANFSIEDITGEQAIDKLWRNHKTTEREGIMLLINELEVLRNANIDAVDTSIHNRLQEAALISNFHLLKAVVHVGGSNLYKSLRPYIEGRIQCVHLRDELVVGGYSGVLEDLIVRAEKLRSLILPEDLINSGHVMLHDLRSYRLRLLIFDISAFIVLTIYQLFEHPYHQSRVEHTVQQNHQSLLLFLNREVPEIHQNVCYNCIPEFCHRLEVVSKNIRQFFTMISVNDSCPDSLPSSGRTISLRRQ